MSQFDFGTIDPYVVDGVQLADFLNNWRNAIHSWHRGPARPSYAVPGMMWINDAGGATNWIVNVYLSPVVGDVAMFIYNTSTGAITLAGASGGSFAAQVLLAQAAASPSVQWNATGNPIDAKAWRMTVNAAGALVLSSYNDAGVIISSVTFNRDGSVGGALKLYSEQVLAAPAAELRANIPAGAKLIEIVYHINNAAGTDATLSMNELNGSTPNVTANHNTQALSAAGSTAAGQAILAAAAWGFQFGNFHFGTARFSLFPTVTMGVNNFYSINSGGGRISAQYAHDSANLTVTGFRLINLTAVNFAVGSYMRAFVA